MASYYRVLFDPAISDMWFLGEPVDAVGHTIDARDFTEGKTYIGPTPLRVSVIQHGRKVRFNFASLDMPVVDTTIMSIVDSLALQSVQFFPVSVNATNDFAILNALSVRDCIDERRSETYKYTLEDDIPELVGKYKMILRLCLDPMKVGDEALFRVGGWEIALIASEALMLELSRFPDSGLKFERVL